MKRAKSKPRPRLLQDGAVSQKNPQKHRKEMIFIFERGGKNESLGIQQILVKTNKFSLIFNSISNFITTQSMSMTH